MEDEIIDFILGLKGITKGGFSENEIMELNLVEDLELDSIELVELISFIEEHYEIEMKELSGFLESLGSIREFISYVKGVVSSLIV